MKNLRFFVKIFKKSWIFIKIFEKSAKILIKICKRLGIYYQIEYNWLDQRNIIHKIEYNWLIQMNIIHKIEYNWWIRTNIIHKIEYNYFMQRNIIHKIERPSDRAIDRATAERPDERAIAELGKHRSQIGLGNMPNGGAWGRTPGRQTKTT